VADWSEVTEVECVCFAGRRLLLLLVVMPRPVAGGRRGEWGMSSPSPGVGTRLEVELAAEARLETLEKLAVLIFVCPAAPSPDPES